MKLTLAFVLTLASAVMSIPSEQSADTALAQDAATACGAAGSCKGFGGSELCNDRCKRCSGPTGPYHRGDCCGFAGQTCCCYYS